jgi:2-(1,2-epoxy-1,2-dihydrophenyl)acetyl-CoA isomerase
LAVQQEEATPRVAFFVCRFETTKLAYMPSILYSQQGGVGVITLNRPEKYNAFNREMALLLQTVLDDCAGDAGVRSILLTGAGKAFCAGQDLAELTGNNPPGFEQILSEHYNPIVSRIRQMPKPIVVAVNGVAAGAGANIALCADVVVASEEASFIQAFSKIGLIPDSGGTFVLPRLVGWQKASAIMMLGDKVGAAEAERLGMIYKVLPAENFTNAALQIAQTLAAMPTQGLALTKQALNHSIGNSFEQQLKTEDQLQSVAAQTSDFKEGMTAFLEKRQPVFTGK